jgi:hypothetical protein
MQPAMRHHEARHDAYPRYVVSNLLKSRDISPFVRIATTRLHRVAEIRKSIS